MRRCTRGNMKLQQLLSDITILFPFGHQYQQKLALSKLQRIDYRYQRACYSFKVQATIPLTSSNNRDVDLHKKRV
jgi:hypothetical protein